MFLSILLIYWRICKNKVIIKFLNRPNHQISNHYGDVSKKIKMSKNEVKSFSKTPYHSISISQKQTIEAHYTTH